MLLVEIEGIWDEAQKLGETAVVSAHRHFRTPKINRANAKMCSIMLRDCGYAVETFAVDYTAGGKKCTAHFHIAVNQYADPAFFHTMDHIASQLKSHCVMRCGIGGSWSSITTTDGMERGWLVDNCPAEYVNYVIGEGSTVTGARIRGKFWRLLNGW